MVLMNVKLDNLLLFRDFSLNFSYPKKPVHSSIEDEHLDGRKNFRYKKLIVLLGANATGKTALGKALMGIFNFIAKKEAENIFRLIDDCRKPASFSVDLAFSDYTLYRIDAHIKSKKNLNDIYTADDVIVSVRHTYIRTTDSYETCVNRLPSSTFSEAAYDFYGLTLESIPRLGWLFETTFSADGHQRPINPASPDLYTEILQHTLQALDPRIRKVEKISSTKKSYVIVYPNHTVLIEDGYVSQPDKLSAGTLDGTRIAQLITGMELNANGFYYCDEAFSHVHTDIEKAFLSLMVDLLRPNQQLFFTTHNLDILEMNLPLHSYAFLRRDDTPDHEITCVFASEYLKKNNISLRNAVENDLFSTVPSSSELLDYLLSKAEETR